jgi:two-component system KDP operon response regulator KdpE
MSSPLILVVDDEPQIHRFLRPMLDAAGYQVAQANTGEEALRVAAAQPISLVLLDLGLPDIDGQEVLVRLRRFSQVPVIVLSARDQPEDKIAALDNGANDYVEKPFDVGELLARARASLRAGSAPESADAVFRNGPLEIDMERRLVRVNGEIVALSSREYDVLALLARNAGQVVTHRQLLTVVWGPTHTQDVQYLRVYVGHLRQKLGHDAGRFVLTERSVGYRLLETEN